MKKRVLTILAVGISLLILTACNGMKYDKAQSNYEAGEYSQAAEAFLALGDHEDSEEMYKESTFQYAKSLIEGKEYQAAIDILVGLDYEGVSETIETAAQKWVEPLCNNNKYDEARAFVDELGGKDVVATTIAVLSNEISYKEAIYLLDNKEYEKATEMFDTLRIINYADTKELWAECIRQHAQSYLDSGENNKAGERISKLLIIGKDYPIAETYASELAEVLGERYIADDQYINAEALIYKLPFTSVKLRLEDSLVCAKGVDAFDAGNYKGAADILRAETNAKAKQYYNKAVYALAMEEYNQGDLYAAEKQFEKIPGYMDVDEILLSMALTFKCIDAAKYNEMTGKNFTTYGSYSSNLFTPTNPRTNFLIMIASNDSESGTKDQGPINFLVGKNAPSGEYDICCSPMGGSADIIFDIKGANKNLYFTSNPDIASVAIFFKITYEFQDKYMNSSDLSTSYGYKAILSLTAVDQRSKRVIGTYSGSRSLGDSFSRWTKSAYYYAELSGLHGDNDFTTFVKAITNTME